MHADHVWRPLSMRAGQRRCQWPWLMSASHCVQANGDSSRKRPTLVDHCVQAKRNAGGPNPTMTERCSQATTDVISPWPTLVERYALAMIDVCSPWLISPGWCRLPLADVTCPKHTSLCCCPCHCPTSLSLCALSTNDVAYRWPTSMSLAICKNFVSDACSAGLMPTLLAQRPHAMFDV